MRARKNLFLITRRRSAPVQSRERLRSSACRHCVGRCMEKLPHFASQHAAVTPRCCIVAQFPMVLASKVHLNLKSARCCCCGTNTVEGKPQRNMLNAGPRCSQMMLVERSSSHLQQIPMTQLDDAFSTSIDDDNSTEQQ